MLKPNQFVRGVFGQLGQLWRIILFLYALMLVFFVILDLISRTSDKITLSYFTRDVTAIGHLPFFAGLVSQLGGLLWAATLAICLFTIFVLRRREQDTRAARRFLLQAAILTAILLLDDYFQFHEAIGPDYLHISEKLIILVYGIYTLFFLFSNYSEILSSEYLILGLALGLFGLSVAMDALHLEHIDMFRGFMNEQLSIFLEDGLKFVGVATWLVFFSRYGYQRVTALLSLKQTINTQASSM